MKRDREETPGSEVAPSLMLPRVLEDDKRMLAGRREDSYIKRIPQRPYDILLRETHVGEKVREAKCRPKLDGHTHSRLSVICIIKEKKKRKSEKERESGSKNILYVYSYGLSIFEAVKRILDIIRI